MSKLLRKKEYKDAEDNLISVVFDFENDKGEIHHQGLSEEHLLLSPEEQKEIAIEMFIASQTEEVIIELNEEL
jgi:hypothetical protein